MVNIADVSARDPLGEAAKARGEDATKLLKALRERLENSNSRFNICYFFPDEPIPSVRVNFGPYLSQFLNHANDRGSAVYVGLSPRNEISFQLAWFNNGVVHLCRVTPNTIDL